MSDIRMLLILPGNSKRMLVSHQDNIAGLIGNKNEGNQEVLLVFVIISIVGQVLHITESIKSL
ncbi:hypothetical protein GCM10011346_00360 [Oceanobacillus neutriphilus]|uniref:Uncharacterized protein n=1 Tax=Oceanobacillus neutriphilus TaxID=531815 RepID=A0ABQ2NM15_9BACI|nr:hypothetical protein GCM10011346_00360 [Oceanobacillus neutriphilus]